MIQIRYKDPILRDLRRRYIRSKGQAIFRGQEWQLEFEDFCEFWKENQYYLIRGRNSESYQLCRIDQTGNWKKDNVIIKTRSQHLRELMLEKNANGR